VLKVPQEPHHKVQLEILDLQVDKELKVAKDRKVLKVEEEP
jgi:hypothetical protein